MDKSNLRIKAKNLRRTLDMDAISSGLVKQIREFEPYILAKNVLIYYPMKHEVNLLELLNDTKNFYLPKVNGQNLFVCPFSKGQILEKSSFNIMEPCSSPVNPEILDLIFVPALTVDGNNYRLGYGGGFYDRFIGKYPDITTVVPVAKELYTDSLPICSYDKPVDFVIKY